MQISTRHCVAIKAIVRREIDAARIRMYRVTTGNEKTVLHLNHADTYLEQVIQNIQRDCMEVLKGS